MEKIKTYVINGFFIFVPIALVVFLISKTVKFLKTLVDPLSSRMFPEGQFGADLVVNIFLGVLFISLCFLLGFFSNKSFMKKIISFLENTILVKIPGYTFFKGITHNIQSSTKSPENFQPIIVLLDDNTQLGFKIETVDEEKAVVYLPGAPNPWSGSIIYVEFERIKPLDVSVADAIKHLKELGRNSAELYKQASS